MQFYSTNDPTHKADLATAIFRGLPADNGLYMPERLDPLPPSFFRDLPERLWNSVKGSVSGRADAGPCLLDEGTTSSSSNAVQRLRPDLEALAKRGARDR